MDMNEDRLNEITKDPMALTDDELAKLMAGEGGVAETADVVTTNDTTENVNEVADKADSDTAKDVSATTSEAAGASVTDGSEVKEQEQPTGVATRDGKHIIPYGVLQHERAQRLQAERAAQELAERIALLEQQQATGAVPAQNAAINVDAEMLSSLEAESPEMANFIKGMVSKISTLESQLQETKKPVEEYVMQKDLSARATVEEAIAANPKLTYLLQNNPQGFQQVAQIDTFLASGQDFADASISDRFNTALKMYEARYGAVTIPSQDVAQPQQSAADTNVAVAKALANASKQGGVNTLSDIPGGALPPNSSADAFDQQSAAAITEQMMNMTPAQIDAMLARL